jgi:RNA polymerase sigma factor (sigma-70 family)
MKSLNGLVERFQSSESEEVFQEILQQFERPITTMMSRWNFTSDVDDVKQKLRMKVWYAAKTFDKKRAGQFTTYCYTALRSTLINCYHDYSREHYAKGPSGEALPVLSLEASSSDEDGEEVTIKDMIPNNDEGEESLNLSLVTESVMSRLTGKAKKIAELIVQGKSFAEVAKQMKLSQTRCRNLLRGYKGELISLM